MKPWKTLSKETILEHSFLTVESHSVRPPDGEVIEKWPWVIISDYTNVVAVTEAGDFVCLKQVKYAINEVSLATVGGFIDPGEDPLSAAKRELLEETGCEAGEWIDLGSYIVDANRGAGKANLFLALGTVRVKEPDYDDIGGLETVRLTRSELETALLQHEFKVLGWTTAISLALLYMNKLEAGAMT